MGNDCTYIIEKINTGSNLIQFFIKTIQLSKEFDYYYIFMSSKRVELIEKARKLLYQNLEKEDANKQIYSSRSPDNEIVYDFDCTVKNDIDISQLVSIFQNDNGLTISNCIHDVIDPIIENLIGCDLILRIGRNDQSVVFSFRRTRLNPDEMQKIENRFDIKLRFEDCI